MVQITPDYAERVYAGVLGKVIGVYLGRPFEGWSYERIQQRLGDIEYYVHDKLDVPLIVTDDDIAGTFTFIRALEDHGTNPDISPKDIGESWLNYLIKGRSVLWWGGLGQSTEHRLPASRQRYRRTDEWVNGNEWAGGCGANWRANIH